MQGMHLTRAHPAPPPAHPVPRTAALRSRVPPGHTHAPVERSPPPMAPPRMDAL